jgi:protein SCO1
VYIKALFLILLIQFSSCVLKSSSKARSYSIRGKIVSIDRQGKKVIVDHEEIPGFMSAMVMPFTLEEEWPYTVMNAGDRIEAELVVDEKRSWLQNPVITRQSEADKVQAKEPVIGSPVPKFTLTNQNGKKIQNNSYKGKSVLITFIYTRCPLPDYCPLMTTKFSELHKKILEDSSLRESTQLLSVSVDPEYDTPKVLKEYTKEHGIESANWEFASGEDREIRKLAESVGLHYFPEKNEIIHSLRTALISPDGKIHKIYRGSDWKTEELVKEIRGLKPFLVSRH